MQLLRYIRAHIANQSDSCIAITMYVYATARVNVSLFGGRVCFFCQIKIRQRAILLGVATATNRKSKMKLFYHGYPLLYPPRLTTKEEGNAAADGKTEQSNKGIVSA